MTKLMTMIFLLLISPIVLAGKLAPAEENIRFYIDDQKSSQIGLLEKLVKVDSTTNNIKGVHEVGEILRPEFAKIGFQTQWIEQPAKMQRAGIFIAYRKGKKNKRVLLIGHLDTVLGIKGKAFKSSKNTAEGPGVADDKGGVVVLLYALKALQKVNALDDLTITVVLTGDEEESGKPTSISRKPLIDAAKNVDVALDFEPTPQLDAVTIARRGISNWWIETSGEGGHSSIIFQKEVGAGAIFELTRILNSMREKLIGEKDFTLNPGIILAGTTIDYQKNDAKGSAFGKQNVIAKTALASGDIRYISQKQKKHIKKKMIDIVNKHHLSHTSATIQFIDGIPAMPPTKANLNLLQQYSSISKDLGKGKVVAFEPGLRGAADISYVANIVKANLSGLGPLGSNTHAVDEAVDVVSMSLQATRAAILLYRLGR